METYLFWLVPIASILALALPDISTSNDAGKRRQS